MRARLVLIINLKFPKMMREMQGFGLHMRIDIIFLCWNKSKKCFETFII